LSTAGNNGITNSTLALSANVPPGAAAGTQSITTNAGGIVTNAKQLLTNPIVAAAGGFRYDVSFLWDGTDSSGSNGGVEKIIDYAGTESLQLTVPAGAGSADLEMGTSLDTGGLIIAASTTISPNTWYNVTMTFDTQGNPVVAGDLTGLVSLYVNGSLVSSGMATKGTQGDTLNRPIGVGELGSTFGHIVFLRGQIYNPSVSLGVPEPASLVLLSLVGVFGFALRKRA
jgi:hypothetical protein